MSLETFVKEFAITDSLKTGAGEENLTTGWGLATGSNNKGKKTTTGWTTQTEKKEAGAIFEGTYTKALNFICGGTLSVLPGANSQVINFQFTLEGGELVELYMVRESATLAYMGIEKGGVTLKEGPGVTWAVGDQWYLACYEGKLSACRITSGGTYSNPTGYKELGTIAKKGEKPDFVFGPTEASSSTVFRLTNFKGGGEAAAETEIEKKLNEMTVLDSLQRTENPLNNSGKWTFLGELSASWHKSFEEGKLNNIGQATATGWAMTEKLKVPGAYWTTALVAAERWAVGCTFAELMAIHQHINIVLGPGREVWFGRLESGGIFAGLEVGGEEKSGEVEIKAGDELRCVRWDTEFLLMRKRSGVWSTLLKQTWVAPTEAFNGGLLIWRGFPGEESESTVARLTNFVGATLGKELEVKPSNLSMVI